MYEIKKLDDLMIFLINLIGEKFPLSAILKGGMSLRLLNSPRCTNDLDYIFIQVLPDLNVLEDRLTKISSTPRNKNPKQMTLYQLLEKLQKSLNTLSSDSINELSDYLPSDNLLGLELKMKVNLLKMVDEIKDCIIS